MKKVIYLALLLGICTMYSCGSSTNKSNEAAKEEKEDAIKDCDDFIAYYEEWADDYIKVIDNYIQSPTDEGNAEKYMTLVQEAMELSTKWITLVECADDERYSAKFEEISKEIEKKLNEVGL